MTNSLNLTNADRSALTHISYNLCIRGFSEEGDALDVIIDHGEACDDAMVSAGIEALNVYVEHARSVAESLLASTLRARFRLALEGADAA